MMKGGYNAAALAAGPLSLVAADLLVLQLVLLLLLHACYTSLLNAGSGMQPVLFTLSPRSTAACKCTLQAPHYGWTCKL
jgi:hypothetical protein